MTEKLLLSYIWCFLYLNVYTELEKTNNFLTFSHAFIWIKYCHLNFYFSFSVFTIEFYIISIHISFNTLIKYNDIYCLLFISIKYISTILCVFQCHKCYLSSYNLNTWGTNKHMLQNPSLSYSYLDITVLCGNKMFLNWIWIVPNRYNLLFYSLGPCDAICRHRTRSVLAQVMVCCLTEPSNILNHCWLIIS